MSDQTVQMNESGNERMNEQTECNGVNEWSNNSDEPNELPKIQINNSKMNQSRKERRCQSLSVPQ